MVKHSTDGSRRKSKAEIARNMSAIRSKENATEAAFRKALFALGLRYRKYHSVVPGNPDIVFPAARVAVFVDGDYWHARVFRERGPRYMNRALQGENRDYWLAKFTRRIALDDQANKALAQMGWVVLRFWESDLKRDMSTPLKRTARLVNRRKRQLRH